MFKEKRKEKEEAFVLELITSIIETKKPKTTIEAIVALANKKGDFRLATKLQDVLSFIEQGKTYIDSFYYSDMLTEETYSIFRLADEKSALNKDMILERIDDKENIRKIDKLISSSLIQPFVLIFFAVGANIFIVTRMIPILISFYKDDHTSPPSYLEPFIFANSHPIIGFFILLSIMYAMLFIIIFLIKNKTGRLEMTLYRMSSTIKNLKNIGLGYEQIFLQMYESEKDKKVAQMYYEIYFSVSKLSVVESLEPIFDKVPISTAVIIFDKISKNDDVQAWHFAKTRLKEETFSKIESFSRMLPFVGYIFIFLVISIAIVPIGTLVQKALSMV